MATPIIRKKAAPHKRPPRKRLASTELIVQISVRNDGASVARLMAERVIFFSDQALVRLWRSLVIVSFLDFLLVSLYQSLAYPLADLAATWNAGYTYLIEISLYRMVSYVLVSPQAPAFG